MRTEKSFLFCPLTLPVIMLTMLEGASCFAPSILVMSWLHLFWPELSSLPFLSTHAV